MMAHGWMPWQVTHLDALELTERYKIIFDKSPIGVFFCESEPGRFLNANEAFCNMMGYSLRELRKLDWKTITHPEDIQRDESTVNTMESRVFDTLMDYKKRFVHKNGKVIHVSIYAKALYNSGILLYYVCHVLDKSHEHSVEAALASKSIEMEKLHERLIKADAALERLRSHVNDLMSGDESYAA
jgi:PAS domain S-box-containing protein